MASIGAAEQVVLHGYWRDEDGQAVSGNITLSPVKLTGQSGATPNLKDLTSFTHIQTRVRTAVPDAQNNGYFAVLALASNDPDVDAYGGRQVTFSGYDPYVVQVPYTAPTYTVDAKLAAQIPSLTVGQTVRALWLIDAPDGSNPPAPVNAYWTADQTASVIDQYTWKPRGSWSSTASYVLRDVVFNGSSSYVAVGASTNVAPGTDSAKWQLLAAGGGGSVPDATTSVKGQSVLLGGTADNPTVPYSKVTGAPASLPPSGGAGGVLGGSFPNPSFALDMATQAELDAVNASIPEQARDALGAALVAGANVTITPDDSGDTITIAVTIPSSYSDEQAQDAVAALIAAGSHSGINFAYDDANNSLSATVAAQSWTQITGKPTFATVATSGAYTDLSGKPSIPATYADLTGTVPQAALPAVALTDFLGAVASQTAMLALVGQRGDWATRTDRGTDWQLIADDSTQLSSWREMSYPASPVSSVNGRTGAVAGLAESTDPRFTDTRVPTDASVTDAKVAPSAAIAESKLNLASDGPAGTASRRTLGTGAQQATAGNDSRLSDARPWSLYSGSATAGQVPVWNGSGFAPGSAVGALPYTTQAASVSVPYGAWYGFDTTSAARTATLPAADAAAVAAGRLVQVSWDAADSALANKLTVATAGSDLIVTATGTTANANVPLLGEVLEYQAVAINRWRPVSSFKATSQLDLRYASTPPTVTGLVSGASADNTAAIQAALDARRASSAGAVVVPRNPAGAWRITGKVIVYDGMSLLGEGGADGYSATEILCDAAGAGIEVRGGGGHMEKIELNGNNVATNPLYITGIAANRLFTRVDVHNAAQDNVVVEYLQNSTFLLCSFNRAGRDGLVIDKEAGGLQFISTSITNSGRRALTVQQSIAPTTDYTVPSHIRFDHSILERTVADNPTVLLDKGFMLKFDSCIFNNNSTTQTTGLFQMSSGAGPAVVEDCQFAGGGAAGLRGIVLASGTQLILNGRNIFQVLTYAIDNPSGGSVQVNGTPLLNSGSVLVTTGTPSYGDQNVLRDVVTATSVTRPVTGLTAMKGRVAGEAGERFRMLVDGSITYGSGADYSFPTTIGRRSDGAIGVTGGLATDGTFRHTGSSVGFYNTTPTSRPTITGSRAGSPAMASLLAGLASQGLVVDSSSADAVPITSVSANYTLVLADAFGAVHSTAAGAITITIPPASSVAFTLNTVIEFVQYGAGQVTIAGGTGVTIRTSASATTRAQYSVAVARRIGADEWLLSGDLT